MSKLLLNKSMSFYQEYEALSKSMLSEIISKTPLHMKRKYLDAKDELNMESETPYYDLYKEKPRKDFDVGTAVHCFALEPENYNEYVAIKPEVNLRTKQGKKDFNDFLKKNWGKAIIREEDQTNVEAVAKNILAHPMSAKLLTGTGYVESSIFWERKDTGTKMKCRPDFINPDLDIVVDIKTDKDGDPFRFKFNAKKYKYHLSHAITAEGYEAHFGRPLQAYIYLVIEKPTGDVIFYNSEEDCLLAGQELLEKYIPQYEECLKTGDWTGYSQEIQPLNMP